LKITEEAHIFGLLAFRVKVKYFYDKNGLGHILGVFFQKLVWSLCMGGDSMIKRNVKQTISKKVRNIAENYF
jgi:glutamine cyclotransferase